MRFMLDAKEVQNLIKQYYFEQGHKNIKVNIKPVVIDNHYEFHGDALIQVFSESCDGVILDNEGLTNIFNEELNGKGYKALDAACSVSLEDGKATFKGVQFVLNEMINRRSL